MSARLRFVPRLNIITVRLGAFGFRVRLLYILMHSKECFLFFREKRSEYKFQTENYKHTNFIQKKEVMCNETIEK